MKKFCCLCNTIKPLGFFGNDRSSSDGLKMMCKPCYKIAKKEGEIAVVYSPKWKKENTL